MGYNEEFEKKEKNGKVKQATTSIMRWKESGDSIVGLVKEVKLFDKSKFDTRCNVYYIETDEGIKSCVLGAATDQQLDPESIEGKLIKITFMGKAELGDGRNCNTFDIKVA